MSSDAQQLLRELEARDIELDAVGGQLRVRAPRGALPAELRARLQALKGELLTLLESQPSPLAGAQRQLWFHDRIEGSGSLQLVLRLRLLGALDRARLDAALGRLIDRHEALRTRIEVHDGTPTQVVLDDRSPSWSRAPTDPSHGRPFVVALEQRGPDEHELLLQVHHLVCDGWSMAVLLEDLGRLYSGAALPELPIRPRDVAREFSLRERSPEFEARLDAWAARSSDAAPIELPLDRHRPDRPSSAGASATWTIEPERWAAAVAYARSRSATAFMLVAAAVAVVLVRWTRTPSPCLGIPHANRGRPELEGVVAMLVDTLLLRIELGPDEDLSFDAVLERAREAVLATLDHGELPLDRVVGRLHRTRAGGRAGVALPNVMLNFAAFAEPRPQFEGLACEVEASMPGSRFDLTIYAYPRDSPALRGERLDLEAAYRSELFEPETIAALLRQIAVVLEQAPTQPTRSWRALPLGHGEVEPSPDRPYSLSLLATIASWSGSRVAIVGANETSSHAQLHEEASRLAHAIADALERVAIPGRRVAIYARRTPTTIVALLAVLAAGASFVLLDATYPSARLAEMIELTQPSAWVDLDGARPPELADALPDHTRIWPFTKPAALHDLPTRPPDDEAYVAFTSGTTGRPRAVVCAREPLEHFFAWYRDALALDMHDRFAWLSGLGHDPSLRDIFGALCVGAQIYVPPRAPVEMGAELGSWLAASAITVVHWTPSLARAVAATLVRPLVSLRRVCFGGDRLRGDDVRTWQRLAPHAELFNFYGTTETPQAIAVHHITDIDAERPLVPIGRGIEGVTLELETAAGPAAVGEIGEIVVRTRHLARGYIGEPEQTRERFVGAGSSRAYRTGDLGRLRHDGSVVCLGRIDDQVQIRGERIELGEVEAVLGAHAGARVAVSARERDDGERELVAWVAGGTAASLLALREAAAARLPRAQLPTRWAAIAELPLTANAKLDRTALARLPLETHELEAGDVAPDNPLELALAPIWAELLGREHVGRHDDFFAIGGHSLLAVRLAVRIHEALGVELPIWALFERPTLAGCAAAIERQRVAGLPELRVRDHGSLAPASFAQVHIWLLHQLDEGAPPPSIVHSLRLRDALDETALARALVELEQRHEVLRTTFVLVDDRLCARIGPARARVLEHGPPLDARFDLERGPLWRAHLWTNDVGERRLELELHHICGEAGSMRILARDLVELYEAARDDRAPELPVLGCRHVDVAVWQRELTETPVFAQALARWQQRLTDVQPLDLPHAPHSSFRGGSWLEVELEPELARGIEQLAARESTTSFVVLLCALGAVLARWCGTTDVTIGAPVGMRPHPATRELIGPFLDLVALRLDASEDPSLGELLARTRARVREAFADSLVPFEQILQALYAEPRSRNIDRTPVFQVLLNMVDVGETERLWAQLGAERLVERELIPRYELAVYAVRRPQTLHLAVLYDASRFEPEQGRALLDHLRASLRGLLDDPQRRLSALALRRPDAECPPAPTRVRDELPYERFVAIANAHAQAVAIDMGTRTVSYAELHARVAAVAERLHGFVRIGLLVHEDEHMAAGMLAALALGITYVPLDPRLPAARLRELISDAEIDTLACTNTIASLASTLAEGRPIVVLDHRLDIRAPSPLTGAHPDAIAYLLYTSGSTGRPKAVMQSQANLLHHALTYAERLELRPGDRVSLVATHAFDAAVMDIYGALLSGATLCPIDLHGRALVELDAELRQRGITIFHATPTVVRHLLASRTSSARLDRVRAVVLGGEEAHAADAWAIAACFGQPDAASGLGSSVRIINGLGPTECTLALQEFVDQPPLPGSLAVGRPVPGVAISLETPVGEQPAMYGVGEILLDSPRIALGYWRRAPETERVFSHHDGHRRYRSGDLGRWLPGGRIGFVGRRGGFIKLRGHRIEPGEIEARLRALPGVHAAAVVLRESELLGFYVGPELDERELSTALAAELPSWMLPTRLLHLDKLPHTPTGKLDRRALEQLPVPPLAVASARATTNSEAQILEIWTHVLGHAPPGLDRDWFICGGDSLGAARLVRALDRRLGLTVALTEIFEGCSIGGLARRLDGRDEIVPISRARTRQLADGRGEPWICVLPPGLRPALLEPLAARFDRPLWTVEPPSFGESGPLPTIHDIIAALARALEHEGPHTHESFVLAGISNGGLLACELLATWPATSPRPRALVLFDSPTPEQLAARPWSARSESDLRAGFVQALCGASVDDADFAAMFARYRNHGERVWQTLHRLDLRDRIATPVILIEARNGEKQLGARWRTLTPNLRTHAVAGDHLDIFAEQHVDTLVDVLLGR